MDEELSVLVAPALLRSVVAVLVVAECNFGVAVWQLALAAAAAVADQLAVAVIVPKEYIIFSDGEFLTFCKQVNEENMCII